METAQQFRPSQISTFPGPLRSFWPGGDPKVEKDTALIACRCSRSVEKTQWGEGIWTLEMISSSSGGQAEFSASNRERMNIQGIGS